MQALWKSKLTSESRPSQAAPLTTVNSDCISHHTQSSFNKEKNPEAAEIDS